MRRKNVLGGEWSPDNKTDCIHIHACRRVQAIGRQETKRYVPRFCEKCKVYVSEETEVPYVGIETAVDYARDGVSSIKRGYGEYDTYSADDLHCIDLRTVIASAKEGEQD